MSHRHTCRGENGLPRMESRIEREPFLSPDGMSAGGGSSGEDQVPAVGRDRAGDHDERVAGEQGVAEREKADAMANGLGRR